MVEKLQTRRRLEYFAGAALPSGSIDTDMEYLLGKMYGNPTDRGVDKLYAVNEWLFRTGCGLSGKI
jgi:hypothetical protein